MKCGGLFTTKESWATTKNKEVIDRNFFASKEACEKYIDLHKYNYEGENIRPFKVFLRKA